jgi:hypothetical protein
MRQVTRKGLITVAAAGGVLALGGGYAHADAGAAGAASHSPGVLSGNSVQVPVHAPINVCGNTVNVVGVLNPAMGNSCANVSGKAPSTGGSHGGSHDDGSYGGSHDSGHGPGYGDDGPDDGGYGGGSHGGGSHDSGSHNGGSHAGGGTDHSPGVGSGNDVEVPIDVPVNVCGLDVNIIGVGNPAYGNDCENDSPPVVTPPGEEPGKPGKPVEPGTPVKPPVDRDIPPAPEAPGAPNTPDTQNVAQPVGSDELASTGAGQLGFLLPAAGGLLLAGGLIYRRTRATA